MTVELKTGYRTDLMRDFKRVTDYLAKTAVRMEQRVTENDPKEYRLAWLLSELQHLDDWKQELDEHLENLFAVYDQMKTEKDKTNVQGRG